MIVAASNFCFFVLHIGCQSSDDCTLENQSCRSNFCQCEDDHLPVNGACREG